VIGCGTMGQAIVGGLLDAGVFARDHVVVTARTSEAARALEHKLGTSATMDNIAACRRANVVLIALKPQRVGLVVDQPAFREAATGKLVISIAAGVDLEQLSRWLPDAAVIRAMPNTPCLIGEGMTVIARGRAVTDVHAALAMRMFEAVGRCIELEDKHMDAVTSLNSSGPAFAYVILEALADGGVMIGLPRDVALQIAAQMFQGSARMVLGTGFHPAALKDQVTTPAGCTIAGILTMEDGRIRSVLARTVQEAARVASGLGKTPEKP